MRSRVRPKFGRTNAKVGMLFCLVPKDTIFHFITLAGVIYDKAFIVLCTLVHDLAEELK
jgi:hypothetical protein